MMTTMVVMTVAVLVVMARGNDDDRETKAMNGWRWHGERGTPPQAARTDTMLRKAEVVGNIHHNLQPSAKAARVNGGGDGDAGGADAENRCKKQLKTRQQRRERSWPTRLSSWPVGIRARNLCSAVFEHVVNLVGSKSPRHDFFSTGLN